VKQRIREAEKELKTLTEKLINSKPEFDYLPNEITMYLYENEGNSE